MTLQGKVVGFGMCASHCNLERALGALEQLVQTGAEVIPILSHNTVNTATRFGSGLDWVRRTEEITGRPVLRDIPEVEPFGPKKTLDVMAVVPCTGNTLAKLANAITETPVAMAVKATLRNGRPVVLAVTTNDGLGLNAKNLGLLLAARGFYFVPFGQDHPFTKPTSIEADFDLLIPTIEAALEGRQLQPLLIDRQALERVTPAAVPNPVGAPVLRDVPCTT